MAGHVKLLTPDNEGNLAEAPALPAAASPDTLAQVRELLYGDAMRNHGRRVEDVQDDVHALEQRMLKRFAEMQGVMDALARALRQEQGQSVRAIGGAMVELGKQIAAMGELRGADPKNA